MGIIHFRAYIFLLCVFLLLTNINCSYNSRELSQAKSILEDFLKLVRINNSHAFKKRCHLFKIKYNKLNYAILVSPPYRTFKELESLKLDLSYFDKRKIIRALQDREKNCIFLLLDNNLAYYKYIDTLKIIKKQSKSYMVIINNQNIEKANTLVGFKKKILGE